MQEINKKIFKFYIQLLGRFFDFFVKLNIKFFKISIDLHALIVLKK